MAKRKLKITKANKQKIIGIFVILILSVIGVRLLFLSHAQSPYASISASTGVLAGNASKLVDSTASNGEKVEFGSTSGTIACTNSLKGSASISLQSGTYNLQGDEWDSSEPFSLCNDDGIDFTIASSSIDNTGGAPGAYPDIYKGCNWGACTTNSGLPVLVSTMSATPNTVTSSYNTSVVSGTWDDSYDIWYNSGTSTSNNETNGLEMMIWLDHEGGVQPIGSVVASNVSIDGISFNVWYGSSTSTYGTVSYVTTSPITSVSNIDLGKFAADSVSRGYMKSTFYLIDVPVGFETWVGGTGLTVNSFSVTVK